MTPLDDHRTQESLGHLLRDHTSLPDDIRNVLVAAQKQIEMLLSENRALQEGVFRLETKRAVTAPEQFTPLFDAAQRTVHDYFKTFCASPSQGHIEIANQRYLLVRASALSVDFFKIVRELYGDRSEDDAYAIAQRLLFDLAHAIGMSDARAFHDKMGLKDPVQKLSAGPVHFAYAGWASVHIKSDSRPSPDDDFYLAYDHPYSFEANSWIQGGIRSKVPICIMNTGYSSGWCEESFGIKLTAVEVSCRARGDETCSFIMAPPHRINAYIQKAHADRPGNDGQRIQRAPAFFETKQMEERLRANEERYRELFANMNDCVAVFEARKHGEEFILKDLNAASLRTERIDLQSVVGRKVDDVFPGIAEFGLLDVLRRVFISGRPEHFGPKIYHDGRIHGWRDNYVYRLPSGDIVAVYRDVSEQKQLESELRQSQKLEAVGQLAAGIAHEINTPTQFIGDSLQFLADGFRSSQDLIANYRSAIQLLATSPGAMQIIQDLHDAEEKLDYAYISENSAPAFDRALEGIARISGIVRAMKEFAHPGHREMSAADLNHALETTLVIAKNEYKYIADIDMDLGELPPVFCSLGDLNQVFLNLIVNAAHAIADQVGTSGNRGRIRISTRRIADTVRIDVSDTGCGIPDAIKDRIFEPFFTTKEVGRGSGQGLTLARSVVVEKHGGLFFFESKMGKGTTFSVVIPIHGKVAAALQ